MLRPFDLGWFVGRRVVEFFGGILSTELSGVSAGQAPDEGERRVKAVLWDMDGTLVDTEPYWLDAEQQLVEAHGGTWTEQDAMALVGRDLLDSGRYIREHGGVDLPPKEIVELLLDGVVQHVRRAVPWRPGARELLAALRREGTPCALVTMSWERFVAPVLAALPHGSFDVVVTGDAVSRGKPHPEPYLHAARLLGVEPSECLAIEDSNTGARSAEAAGCLVVVVENHVRVEPGERRVFLPSLDGVGPAQLAEIAARS
jgi:HAD superfamily hydrolase (TIGR01509 family)